MSPTSRVTCDTLLGRISAYLDGDLTAATCAAIERHAASCAECGRILDDFRKTTGLCRKAAATPLPATVKHLAKARVRELMGKMSS